MDGLGAALLVLPIVSVSTDRWRWIAGEPPTSPQGDGLSLLPHTRST